MKNIQIYSLLIIAIILIAQFILNYIWPVIYLKTNYKKYYESSINCELAKNSFQASIKSSHITIAEINQKIINASLVELVDCHEHELYKRKLINNGVNENDLEEIHLEAMEDIRIPLTSLVKPYIN